MMVERFLVLFISCEIVGTVVLWFFGVAIKWCSEDQTWHQVVSNKYYWSSIFVFGLLTLPTLILTSFLRQIIDSSFISTVGWGDRIFAYVDNLVSLLVSVPLLSSVCSWCLENGESRMRNGLVEDVIEQLGLLKVAHSSQ
jgi:hypothetical protein